MAKKIFKCNQIDLNHAQMVELRNAGHLNLGIDDGLSAQIASQGIGPRKSTAPAAFHFWNWIALAAFAYTVYLSFTSAWWWFIVGLIGMGIFWKANQSGNSQNLLDAAMMDKEFYDRVRNMNGWLYQIEEAEAQKYLPR